MRNIIYIIAGAGVGACAYHARGSEGEAMAAIAEFNASGNWPGGPAYLLGSTSMPPDAARALLAQSEYSIGEVMAGWDRGEYGGIVDSATGETIRSATESEAIESLTASREGHIEVDGRDCFVSF